jgi:hypothetical protein
MLEKLFTQPATIHNHNASTYAAERRLYLAATSVCALTSGYLLVNSRRCWPPSRIPKSTNAATLL